MRPRGPCYDFFRRPLVGAEIRKRRPSNQGGCHGFCEKHSSITLNMIVDLLDSEEIVSSPACLSRSFKWVSSMRWEKGVVPEQDMIIVCQDKAAEQTAALYPQSFLIVLADGEPAQALEKVLHQALVIKHSAASVNLLQKLQNYFLSIQGVAQRAEPGTRVARRHPDRPAEKQRHAGSAPAALRRRPFACRKVRLQRGHAPVQDVPYAREGGAQQRLHAAPPARVPERNERQHLRGERAHPVRGERPFVRARPAREGPHPPGSATCSRCSPTFCL